MHQIRNKEIALACREITLQHVHANEYTFQQDLSRYSPGGEMRSHDVAGVYYSLLYQSISISSTAPS